MLHKPIQQHFTVYEVSLQECVYLPIIYKISQIDNEIS